MSESQSRIPKSCTHDDDGKIKSSQTGEVSDLRRKSVRKKRNIAESSAKCSLKSGDESLQTAEHLIQDIDTTINSDTGSGRRRKSLAHCPGASSSNDHGPKRSNAGQGNNRKVVRKTSEPFRVKAYDDYGRIDLDAVEKWVTASNIDIDLDTEKEMSLSVSKLRNESKNIPDKFEKADVAVFEIDTIIDGIPPVNTSKQSNSTSQSTSKNKPPVTISPPGPSSSSKISQTPEPMPAAPCPRPLQSIRLPPVKINSTKSKDIFHEKIACKPTPQTSRNSQKSVNPTRNLFSELKESKEMPETAEKSECLQKAQATGSAAKYAPEYLLPGQVSENRFSEVSCGEMDIRTIVLDYSASENDRKKARENRCGLTRFCARLCCCATRRSGVEVLERGNMEGPLDTMKETRRSIPRRLWKRAKRCFGF